ncbi:hypothetical protein ACFSCW_02820 [Sphingomonas tabacisoli]|uniref:Uncharacterized protein n=1 Tax=Sphingomonas tabacisoli TaxID=2249466 RepID=A0ABW4I108_9SPHN
MAGYRLHCLDGGGHIVERHDFDADDDGAALDYARARYPNLGLELWELGRRVVKLPPTEVAMNGFRATGQVI